MQKKSVSEWASRVQAQWELIERHEMIRVMHEEHAFSDLFLAFLLGRIMRTQADLVDLQFRRILANAFRLSVRLSCSGVSGMVRLSVGITSSQKCSGGQQEGRHSVHYCSHLRIGQLGPLHVAQVSYREQTLRMIPANI
jgi:hypothetical protein